MGGSRQQLRFPQERHRRMAQLIEDRGRLTVGELIVHFDVSGPTARRDLAVLSDAGLAVRTHGGVVAPRLDGVAEPLFMEKLRVNQALKKRIAAGAARHVGDGQRILLDSGTTTLALARALSGRDVSVIAMDLKVAEAAATGRTRVSVLGGEVRNGYYSLVGARTLDALDGLGCDTFFMAADALDADGVSTSTVEEAEVKRAGIAAAARTVLLADHSKLDERAPEPVCELDRIDLFVTDRKASGQLAPYRPRLGAIELH